MKNIRYKIVKNSIARINDDYKQEVEKFHAQYNNLIWSQEYVAAAELKIKFQNDQKPKLLVKKRKAIKQIKEKWFVDKRSTSNLKNDIFKINLAFKKICLDQRFHCQVLNNEGKNEEARASWYDYKNVIKPKLIEDRKEKIFQAKRKWEKNKTTCSSLQNDIARAKNEYNHAVDKFNNQYNHLKETFEETAAKKLWLNFNENPKQKLIRIKNEKIKKAREDWKEKTDGTIASKFSRDSLKDEITKINERYINAIDKYKDKYSSLILDDKKEQAKEFKANFRHNIKPKLIATKKKDIVAAKEKWEKAKLAQPTLGNQIRKIENEYKKALTGFKSKYYLLQKQKDYDKAYQLWISFHRGNRQKIIAKLHDDIAMAKWKWANIQMLDARKEKLALIKALKPSAQNEIIRINYEYKCAIEDFKFKYKYLELNKEFNKAYKLYDSFYNFVLPKLKNTKDAEIIRAKAKWKEINAKNGINIYYSKRLILGTIISTATTLFVFMMLIILDASNVIDISFDLTNYGSLTLFGVITITIAILVICLLIVATVLYIKQLHAEKYTPSQKKIVSTKV